MLSLSIILNNNMRSFTVDTKTLDTDLFIISSAASANLALLSNG